MPTTPSLTWTAQTRSINQMIAPLNFLQSLYFSNHRTHPVETIEVGYFIRGRKMAPMVRKGSRAIPIEGHSTQFATVEGPNIRIKRLFDPAVLNQGRRPGTVVFATGAEIASSIEQDVARGLQNLRDDIGNRVEWMCAQALRGTISYSVEDGEVFTLTSPRSGDNAITLSTFWNDGTPTNVRPEEDIETAQRVIHTAEGANIAVALCGAEAATYLRRVAKANNWHLDTKGLLDAVQNVRFGAAFDTNGARPIARINGIDFWEYSTAVVDEGGVSQPMIRAKYVEFLSPPSSAGAVMEYASIPEVDDNDRVINFQGEIFSKSWSEKDPPSRVALAHTRPLPVIWRPNATVSMKVVSG